MITKKVMTMQDWYASMMDYEQAYGVTYGIDCRHDLIEIWNLDDNDTVGFFTVAQAKVFFDGLCHWKYDNDKMTFDESENAIMDMVHTIPSDYMHYYEVDGNQMTSCECYCYLKEVKAISAKSR